MSVIVWQCLVCDVSLSKVHKRCKQMLLQATDLQKKIVWLYNYRDTNNNKQVTYKHQLRCRCDTYRPYDFYDFCKQVSENTHESGYLSFFLFLVLRSNNLMIWRIGLNIYNINVYISCSPSCVCICM